MFPDSAKAAIRDELGDSGEEQVGIASNRGFLFPFLILWLPPWALGRVARRLVLGVPAPGLFSVMRTSIADTHGPPPPFVSFTEMCWHIYYVPGPVLGSMILGVNKTGSVPALREPSF